jgi:hypothetical protein
MSTELTSINLEELDWKVIESLSGHALVHRPKISLRVSDGDRENAEVVLKHLRESQPGLSPSLGEAVRVSLHWYAGESRVVYYISLSQMLRDVTEAYARELSPKVTGEESGSISSPVVASNAVSTISLNDQDLPL